MKKTQTTAQQLEQFEFAIDKAMEAMKEDSGTKTALEALKTWLVSLRNNPDQYPDVFGGEKGKALAEELTDKLNKYATGMTEKLNKSVNGMAEQVGSELDDVKKSLADIATAMQSIATVKADVESLKSMADKVNTIEKSTKEVQRLVSDSLPKRRGAGAPPREELEDIDDRHAEATFVKSVTELEQFTRLGGADRLKAAAVLGQLKKDPDMRKLKPEAALAVILQAL
jgi:chromosome segregation ATPase